ncbi:MAG: 30S ribosomal protein S11 [candidate division WWE3 bacterium]|nr:30S ribosomal protein S11 [candidate division WWE3 bacterium]
MANTAIKVNSNPYGKAHIMAGFNNTIITITTGDDKVVAWSSSGSSGFKGSKRATPYAASMAAEQVAKKALDRGIREVSIFVKGPGSGRVNAIKSLRAAGLQVTSIADVTPIPHNGCRPEKRRRV